MDIEGKTVWVLTAQGEYGEWHEVVSVHATYAGANEARAAYRAGLTEEGVQTEVLQTKIES